MLLATVKPVKKSHVIKKPKKGKQPSFAGDLHVEGAAEPPPSRSTGGRCENRPVALLLVKLVLAPTFVVCASLIARRYGPRTGGLVAGLPVVAGPILLAYALAHGSSFAAGAAAGTLLGLVSLIAFSVLYARLAPRLPWLPCMLAGWLAFAALTAVFSALTVPEASPCCWPEWRSPAASP